MKLISFYLKKIKIIEICLIGFFIRSLTLILYNKLNFGDSQTHREIGQKIFNGDFVPTPIHMPGYGVWLYTFNYLIQNEYGVIFADIIISSLTIYIIYKLSNEIFNDKIVSKIASLVFAFYPISIFFSVNILSESLYVFLIFLAILLLYKKHFILSIVILVLGIYVKSITYYIAPIIIIIFSRYIYKYRFKKILQNLLKYLIISSFLLSPWWVHNFKKYNQFVNLNFAFGYHLYAGNNPLNKSGGGIGGRDVDHSIIQDPSKHDPTKTDKLFKKEAYNFILNNPYDFLEITLVKFLRFWSFYPYSIKDHKNLDQVDIIKDKNIYKIISFISYGSVFFLSLIFIFSYLRKFFYRLLPLLTIIFLYTFAYTLTIVSMRYRFPIEPILIIFASYSAKEILLKKIK